MQSSDIDSIISKVLSEKRIIVFKKTKSGEKEFDIRPLIYEITGEANDGTGFFNVLLSSGQHNNVRPELFFEGVRICTGIDIEMTKMHRIMLYGRAENKWLPLTDERFLQRDL